MRAGGPAVCHGSVVHRRTRPTLHEFRNSLSYVWLDPDDPGALCDPHHWWSASHPAPAHFRRGDYGHGTDAPLGECVRDDLESILGWRPAGEVRMLTQIRRWGWLFNPITVYLAWHAQPDRPVGAVLEVTNTPWKERHRYPVAFAAVDDDAGVGDWITARVGKHLHVSPFLDEQFDYEIGVRGIDERIDVRLDVVSTDDGCPTVTTFMSVTRRPATRAALGRALWRTPIPTHRLSLGIHMQALRLWLKRTPFVAHPSKRKATT